MNMNMYPYQMNRPNRFWKNVLRRSTAWLLMVSTALTGCATMRPKSLMPSWVETSDKVDAKLAYAQLCERHGQVKEATSIYEALVKGRNQEGRQSAMHRLAVMAAKRGDFERADEYFKMASAAGDITAELLNDLGYCYYLQDRFDEAIACYNGALEKNPDSKSALNNLGLAYGQQGKFDKAMIAFQRAGNDAHVHTNMAYVFAQQNQLDQSQKHYLKAISLDKDNRAAAEGLVQVASAARKRKFDGPKIRGEEESTMVAANTPQQSRPVVNPAELAEVVDLPQREKSIVAIANTAPVANPEAVAAQATTTTEPPDRTTIQTPLPAVAQSPVAQSASAKGSRWSEMIFQPNLSAKPTVAGQPTLAPPKPAAVVAAATPTAAPAAATFATAPRLESHANKIADAAVKQSPPLATALSAIPGTASMMDPVAPKGTVSSIESVASNFSTPKLPEHLPALVAKTPSSAMPHATRNDQAYVAAAKPVAQPNHELLTLKPARPAAVSEKPNLVQPSSIWGKSFSPFKTGETGNRFASNKQPPKSASPSSMAALEAKLFEVRPIREEHKPERTMVASRPLQEQTVDRAAALGASQLDSAKLAPLNQTARSESPAPRPLMVSAPLNTKGAIVDNPFATAIVARNVAANAPATLESNPSTVVSTVPKVVLNGIQPEPLIESKATASAEKPAPAKVAPAIELDVAKRLTPVNRSATVAAKPRPVMNEPQPSVTTSPAPISPTAVVTRPTTPVTGVQPPSLAVKSTLFDSTALGKTSDAKPTPALTERFPVVERIPTDVSTARNPAQPTIVSTSKEEPIANPAKPSVPPSASVTDLGVLPSATQALAPKSPKNASTTPVKPAPAPQPIRATKAKSIGMAVVSDADSKSSQATGVVNQPMSIAADRPSQTAATPAPSSTAPMAVATDAAPLNTATPVAPAAAKTAHPLRAADQKLPGSPSPIDTRTRATPDVLPKNIAPMTVTPPSVLPTTPIASASTKSKQPKSAATAYASDRFEQLRPQATLPANPSPGSGGVAFATDAGSVRSAQPNAKVDPTSPAMSKAAPSLNQTPDVTPPNLANPPLRLEIIGKPNAKSPSTSIAKPPIPVASDYQPGSALNNLNQPTPMKSLGLGLGK